MYGNRKLRVFRGDSFFHLHQLSCTMFRTWRKEDKMREMEVVVEEKDAAPSRKVDFDR